MYPFMPVVSDFV
uniref:Uncharacterized protein n=1 Tax=Anguilla anguilla TaxID=7936 RepID=A0A0E9SKJ6_ANGAN